MAEEKYKLTYFNANGRAEIMRWLFLLAGQEYEDIRLTMDEWKVIKPTEPFRQLPVFETEGVLLCQTNAIARYIANKFDLGGKTLLEKAQVDMIVNCAMEIIGPLGYIVDQAPEDKRPDLLEHFTENFIKRFLTYLQDLLLKNEEGARFFIGSSVSLADIMVYHAGYWLDFVKKLSLLDDYPTLKAHRQRVEEIPVIAEWIKIRPVTDY